MPLASAGRVFGSLFPERPFYGARSGQGLEVRHSANACVYFFFVEFCLASRHTFISKWHSSDFDKVWREKGRGLSSAGTCTFG